MKPILHLFSATCLSLCLGAGAALAAGGDSPEGWPPKDPEYAKALKLINAGEYCEAVPFLETSLSKNPKNADALNYMGYSLRKMGNFDDALSNYQKALAIEPRHLGANEYLGELYLQMDDLEKAEERLKVLDGVCFFGCEEYTELKESIASYKAKAGS